jgi:uncharacterized protein YegL
MSEHVLPFYVVCDESYSMTDHLDALNAGLRELHHAVTTDRTVADKIHLCLIGFSGTAEVLVPLAKFDTIEDIACLTAKTATNYGTAFTLLRDTMERDIAALERAEYTVCRPVVFFLSDGQPTDPASWPKTHDRLVDRDWPAWPNIVSFGIGDADPETIRRIGTFKSFMSRDEMSPGTAVREFARLLTSSIIMSDRAAGENSDSTPVIPEQVSGFDDVVFVQSPTVESRR